jgi:hypothetical protein
MQNWLTLLLVLTFSVPAPAGGLQPFPGVPYATVKAHNLNATKGRPECMIPLNDDRSPKRLDTPSGTSALSLDSKTAGKTSQLVHETYDLRALIDDQNNT